MNYISKLEKCVCLRNSGSVELGSEDASIASYSDFESVHVPRDRRMLSRLLQPKVAHYYKSLKAAYGRPAGRPSRF